MDTDSATQTDPHAYDAPPEFEGLNQGLVEAMAERMWLKRWELQGRNPDAMEWQKQTPAVHEGWRKTAEDLIGWLGRIGFTGPGGPPREGGEMVYGWAFDCNDWAIYDRDRGFVALVSDNRDVAMFLQAPVMAETIRAVLARVETQGGVKKADLRALAASLPPEPEPPPPPPVVRDVITINEEAFGG